MAELPAGEIPHNPIRMTGYFTPPVSSYAPSARYLGTDWGRIFRNCIVGGTLIFVAIAAVSVSLSAGRNRTDASNTASQSVPAAAQPIANNSTLSSSGGLRTVYTAAGSELSRIATGFTGAKDRIVAFCKETPASESSNTQSSTDLTLRSSNPRLEVGDDNPVPRQLPTRAYHSRTCPKVPLLPDPDF